MNEPADGLDLRGLATEQSRSGLDDLDLLPADRLVALMCADIGRVPDAVSAAQASITEAVVAITARLERGGRLVYVGAGTAGRIGMLDAAEAGPTFNVPPGKVIAVLAGGVGAYDVPAENAEDDREAGAAAMAAISLSGEDAVVGITASGRTPYVLGAIERAASVGALTVGLACNEDTPLALGTEIAIEVPVGPEIVAGSTRLNAGTAQKVVLNILSTAAMIQLGKTYGTLMVDLRPSNAKLRDRATRIVAEIAGVPLDEAREALERCGWKPKLAAAAIAGGIDCDAAARALERHGGRLRPTLDEVSSRERGSVRARLGGGSRRLGVHAAYVAGRIVRGDVELTGDRITGIGLAGSGSGLAIPGLVDAQVNGYGGIDVLSADSNGLAELGAALLRDGVTAYQPTLISSSEEALQAALGRIAALEDMPGERASITGVHLEGPFLAAGRAGTHPLEHLRAPDARFLERLLDAGPVTMVTLAPELPGALELIKLCLRRRVVVSLGHSEATATDAGRAFAAGARAVTHLFNAMEPLAAREPGLAGAALANETVTLQLIADGVHVSDELIRIALACAPGRVTLVSDAIAAAGIGDGSYRLGDVELTVSGGASRRPDGTLAGSAGRLRDGLARLHRLGAEPGAAIAAVTGRPAFLLDQPGHGRLERGGRADVLVLDERLELRAVFAAGRLVEGFGDGMHGHGAVVSD